MTMYLSTADPVCECGQPADAHERPSGRCPQPRGNFYGEYTPAGSGEAVQRGALATAHQ